MFPVCPEDFITADARFISPAKNSLHEVGGFTIIRSELPRSQKISAQFACNRRHLILSPTLRFNDLYKIAAVGAVPKISDGISPSRPGH